MVSKKHFRIKKDGKPYCDCFCRNPKLIENYDRVVSDETQTWDVHHRKEEFYSQKELIERGEYFDVDPEELIFLTPSEHHKIDSFCQRMSTARKGKKLPEETKRKISKSIKGKQINRKDLSKKVLCVETGEIFKSTKDASRKTGISQGNISNACSGHRKTAGGYQWQFAN